MKTNRTYIGEKGYLQAMKDILTHGFEVKNDRTGTGTYNIMGMQIRFPDVEHKFPLITSKQVFWKMALAEFIWMTSGSTHVKDIPNKAMKKMWANWTYKAYLNFEPLKDSPQEYTAMGWLNKDGIPFDLERYIDKLMGDDEFCNYFGDLGPIYGGQLRNWQYALNPLDNLSGEEIADVVQKNEGIDQLKRIYNQLTTKPYDRGIIASYWNVSQLDAMALRPCHMTFQFIVEPLYTENGRLYDNRLHLHILQRSCDMFLGVPFNFFYYGLMLQTMAYYVGMSIGDLVWEGVSCHIYKNHVDAVMDQIRQEIHIPPQVEIDTSSGFYNLKMHGFKVINYQHGPKIQADVSI